MADIKKYLDSIKTAIFGKDVRKSIYDGIEAINNDCTNRLNKQDSELSQSIKKQNEIIQANKLKQDELEQKYDEQIKNIASSEPQNAEIVDARCGFETLGSIIKKKIYHFDNVEEMKNCLTLIPGDVVETLGFFEVNDGGGATYKIRSKTIEDVEDNGLFHFVGKFVAELIINGKLNVKQLGAYGDDQHDDTLVIQKAIDYSYDNHIFNVFMPNGTYKTVKPLFLYDNCKIYGKNCNSVVIHKATNEKSDVANYKYDAIILLSKRDYTIENYTQNQKIYGIKLQGNIEKYIADKTDNNLQYAILSVKNSPKVQIDSFLISNVDVGIQARGMWTGWIRNCTWLQSYYRAIYITSESQGLNIQNINTANTNVCGIEVNGASYSTLTNTLVEWVYGGTAYSIGNWSGDLLNCGFEVGNGVDLGFKFENAKVRLTGGYLDGRTPNDNGTMFYLNNAIVQVENTSVGYNIKGQEYKGKFAAIGNNSHLTVGKGVQIHCTFRDDITYSGDNNFISINNKTIELANRRIMLENKGFTPNAKDDFIDFAINHTPIIPSRNIYLDNVDTPYENSKGDIQWSYAYNKGDIGFFNNSLLNGKAGWICNRDNATDLQESVGTITEVANGTLKMTDVKLEGYENSGIRLYKNCTIEGVTSNAKMVIASIDFITNKISASGSISGSFQVGEKIRLVKNPNARNGDFIYIPIIHGGASVNRPTKNLVEGQMFFDTTLNKPIWYSCSKWVDASGIQV